MLLTTRDGRQLSGQALWALLCSYTRLPAPCGSEGFRVALAKTSRGAGFPVAPVVEGGSPVPGVGWRLRGVSVCGIGVALEGTHVSGGGGRLIKESNQTCKPPTGAWVRLQALASACRGSVHSYCWCLHMPGPWDLRSLIPCHLPARGETGSKAGIIILSRIKQVDVNFTSGYSRDCVWS